jgi:hypothetical protein
MAKKKLSPKQMKNTKGGVAAVAARRLDGTEEKPATDALAIDTDTTDEAIMRGKR